jgi:peptidoglycan/LPS O-acetylase OafA/YrhL
MPIQREERAALHIDAICGTIIAIGLLSTFTAKYNQVFGHAGTLPVCLDCGYLSLQMFFAVAGYQVMREAASPGPFLSYAQARFARLLPAVVPAVLLSYGVIAAYGLPHIQADLAGFVANLTMLADFVGAPDCGGAFWRLKIEIMFAAGFGLVWFGLGRRAGGVTLMLALAACALQVRPDTPHRTVLDAAGLLTLDGYLPQFTVGIAIFLIGQRRQTLFWSLVLAFCAILVLLGNAPGQGAVVLSAYGIIALASRGFLPPGLPWRALAMLGRPFLAIYLVHQSVGFVVIHALERHGMGPAMAVGAACVSAIACGVAVDAAARALRRVDWADVIFEPRVTGREEAFPG